MFMFFLGDSHKLSIFDPHIHVGEDRDGGRLWGMKNIFAKPTQFW